MVCVSKLGKSLVHAWPDGHDRFCVSLAENHPASVSQRPLTHADPQTPSDAVSGQQLLDVVAGQALQQVLLAPDDRVRQLPLAFL